MDPFGAIEGGRDYEALLPRCVTIDVRGKQVRVLGLDMIAELKRQSRHPKDLAASCRCWKRRFAGRAAADAL